MDTLFTPEKIFRRSKSCDKGDKNSKDKYPRSLSCDDKPISNELKLEPFQLYKCSSSSTKKSDKNKEPKRKSIEEYFKPTNSKEMSETLVKLQLKEPMKKRRLTKKDTKLNGTTITDHFVRRSTRVTTSEKERIYLEKITQYVQSFKEDGLEVCKTADKGRGIVATQNFTIGDFVCEYVGELITYEEAKIREKNYLVTSSNSTGSYLYFFTFDDKKYCIDATPESKRLGRLINHSRINNNIYPRVYRILDKPRVIFFAKRNIKIGEELLFDYGDRSKKSIANNAWLLL